MTSPQEALQKAREQDGDFGHLYLNNGDAHFDIWGAGPFRIYLAYPGKNFLFEDSDRFGPVPLLKNGNIREPGYFADSSQFWYAWGKWKHQGRRLADDGCTCIWSHDEDFAPSSSEEKP
jgi:hypothetical protein